MRDGSPSRSISSFQSPERTLTEEEASEARASDRRRARPSASAPSSAPRAIRDRPASRQGRTVRGSRLGATVRRLVRRVRDAACPAFARRSPPSRSSARRKGRPPGQSTKLHGTVGPGFSIVLTTQRARASRSSTRAPTRSTSRTCPRSTTSTSWARASTRRPEIGDHGYGALDGHASETGRTATSATRTRRRCGFVHRRSHAADTAAARPRPGAGHRRRRSSCSRRVPASRHHAEDGDGKAVKTMKRGTYTWSCATAAASTTRTSSRPGSTAKTKPLIYTGTQTWKVKLAKARDVAVPLRSACPRGHEGLGEDRALTADAL